MMVKLIFILFVISAIGIGLWLIRNPQIFIPQASENIQQLSLVHSVDSDAGTIGQFTTYVYTPQEPAANYNFVGLKGSLAIQSDTNDPVIVLFSLLNYPDGKCIPTGKYPKLGQEPPLSPDNFLTSFILKLNKPGIDQVATDFILPVKVPLKGCVSLSISGGETARGAVVHMNSKMVFLYDTGPAVSPAPYFVNLGDEYCIGRPRGTGCFIGQNTVLPHESFGLFKKIKEPVKLWSLTGNMAVGGLPYPPSGIGNPSGPWATTSDYYVYPGCGHPADFPGVPGSDSFGPSGALSQVPGDAKPLASTILNGTGAVGNQQMLLKFFSDPISLAAGDCLVHLQKFNADGALSQENQIFALVQPYSAQDR